jgi:hypothetical protein
MAAPRGSARLLIGLLLLDAVVAWLALQASFVFLELVWRAVAARENWRPLVESHARQFSWLRTAAAVAWLATAAVFVWWLRRIGPAGSPGGVVPALRPRHLIPQSWRAMTAVAAASRVPRLLGCWWALLCGVIAVEAWALVRLLVAGTPLELGRGLMLVMVASALEVGLAAVTVFVVVAIQDALARAASAR